MVTNDKRKHVSKQLIDEMFKIAGHDVTYQDIEGRKDNWFMEYSMTEEQQKEWIDWGVDYLRKELMMPKYLAEREMDMFNFQYGLTLNYKVQ